jgi:hypothetical protein
MRNSEQIKREIVSIEYMIDSLIEKFVRLDEKTNIEIQAGFKLELEQAMNRVRGIFNHYKKTVERNNV